MKPTIVQVLEFVFQDFWRWLGTILLLGAIAEGIGGMVRAMIQRGK